jgi:RNase P subunit RPR2
MIIFYLYDTSGEVSVIKISLNTKIKTLYCSECVWIIPGTEVEE